jgi:hypothetical protein
MHHRQDAHQKGSDNSASARVSTQFQSRPFGLQAQSEEASPQQQETPDLQTQLERAKRFGPDFSRVRVRAEGPPPTIQSKLFFGEQRSRKSQLLTRWQSLSGACLRLQSIYGQFHAKMPNR